jgi:hypothetical protein
MSHVPYASAIGILMYAMVCTRPDIAHAVGVLSRYISKPGKQHWTAVKRVFRYLHGRTAIYGLCYEGRPGLDRVVNIHGFVDADWDGYLDCRRSTSEYVFNLFGGAISWMGKRQVVVALSTTESEYMAATHESKEAVWLQRLCSGIGLVQQAVRIECDSQTAIFLAKNPTYHSKTKHIDVQYHHVSLPKNHGLDFGPLKYFNVRARCGPKMECGHWSGHDMRSGQSCYFSATAKALPAHQL